MIKRTLNRLFKYHEDSEPAADISFRELTKGETDSFEDKATLVHHLLDRYMPGQSEKGISPRVLDQLFILWLRDSAEDKPHPDRVAVVLGSAFAFYLRGKLKMGLLMANQDNEPALAAQDETAVLTVYPIEAVKKRIASGSAGFFEPIYAVTEEKIMEAQNGHSTSGGSGLR